VFNFAQIWPSLVANIGAMKRLDDFYKLQVNDCRHQAELALSPLDKESWLELADAYQKLADAQGNTACSVLNFDRAGFDEEKIGAVAGWRHRDRALGTTRR
jgi:hypothetical protein